MTATTAVYCSLRKGKCGAEQSTAVGLVPEGEEVLVNASFKVRVAPHYVQQPCDIWDRLEQYHSKLKRARHSKICP